MGLGLRFAPAAAAAACEDVKGRYFWRRFTCIYLPTAPAADVAGILYKNASSMHMSSIKLLL